METMQKRSRSTNGGDERTLFQCAELILPWLHPSELSSIALTCKTLSRISKSIANRRSSDASRNFEKLPIPFINTVDDCPYAYFIYTPSQVINSTSSSQSWGGSSDPRVEPSKICFNTVECGSGCDCERCDEESDGEFECPCSRLKSIKEVMIECGPNCRCGWECKIRLTQRGILFRLKIIRDARKGWGLHAAETIRSGQFVCEYAGELLTTKEARKRHEKYDEVSMGGQFCSALLVVREHLPSGKACFRINIDATKIGNLARFINHSCDGGNLSTALVRSSGALLPRLCFFASRDIQEDEELLFSYGDVRIKSKGLPCFCGSSCCLGTLPSEQT